LVVKEQGRGTHLTPLGARLLWLRERIEARLLPHLESAASEVGQQLSVMLDEPQSSSSSPPPRLVPAPHPTPKMFANDLHSQLDLRRDSAETDYQSQLQHREVVVVAAAIGLHATSGGFA
jgi:hypothetical protein